MSQISMQFRRFTVRAKSLTLTLALGAVAVSGCGNGEGETDGPVDLDEVVARDAIDTYAHIVHATYSDALDGVFAVDLAIDMLLETPSDQTIVAAKQAWLMARDPYGQSEVFRFYGGPIDKDGIGLEQAINAWPIDESYIDYVTGDASSGIVNDPAGFPDLTSEVLLAANGEGGDTRVATGYHAIEFLLWGEDLSADSSGVRPYSDFVVDDESVATADHQDRRATYLRVANVLLADQLRGLADEWVLGGDNYRAQFTEMDTNEALTKILTGMIKLSESALSGGMAQPYDTQDQEYEQSSFSDNTHNDLLNGELGIRNVYLGAYGDHQGTGISDLVLRVDPELDEEMKERLAAAEDAIREISPPFDRAIIDRRDSVAAAIEAIDAQSATLRKIAEALDLSI